MRELVGIWVVDARGRGIIRLCFDSLVARGSCGDSGRADGRMQPVGEVSGLWELREMRFWGEIAFSQQNIRDCDFSDASCV